MNLVGKVMDEKPWWQWTLLRPWLHLNQKFRAWLWPDTLQKYFESAFHPLPATGHISKPHKYTFLSWNPYLQKLSSPKRSSQSFTSRWTSFFILSWFSSTFHKLSTHKCCFLLLKDSVLEWICRCPFVRWTLWCHLSADFTRSPLWIPRISSIVCILTHSSTFHVPLASTVPLASASGSSAPSSHPESLSPPKVQSSLSTPNTSRSRYFRSSLLGCTPLCSIPPKPLNLSKKAYSTFFIFYHASYKDIIFCS